MNKIRIFKNDDFGQVRMFLKNGEVWFVGKDICNILEYQNCSRDIERNVDEEDRQLLSSDDLQNYLRGTFKNDDTIPNRGLIIINESGLYSLMLSSRMPKAREFKHWITHEVLPEIRKTGSYGEQRNTIKSLMNLASEQEAQIRHKDKKFNAISSALQSANLELKASRMQLEGMQKTNEALKMQVDYYSDQVEQLNKQLGKKMFKKIQFKEAPGSAIHIEQFTERLRAKGIDIGPRRFKWYLQKHGYLQKTNYPTEAAIEAGLMDFEIVYILASSGENRPLLMPLITEYGQEFFEKEINSDFKGSDEHQLQFLECEELSEDE